jgi:hypothetical protein
LKRGHLVRKRDAFTGGVDVGRGDGETARRRLAARRES